MTETSPIRLMIVDDHTIARNGIKTSLLAFEDIEVVGEASSGEEALGLASEIQPDVILMDLVMPGMGGIDALRAFSASFPGIRVLALTNFQEGNLVQQALQAGAIGYLLKDVTLAELAQAIRLATRGEPTLAPAAGQALARTVRVGPKLGHDLTEREIEVLNLLAEGLSNQQIAERLVLSTTTVKYHVGSIRAKLGASNRTEAVILALQHNLVKDS
ncbi:MAG TPA: response regulator transcription factor [Ktedonobacterales bacterium]|jgi:NarL family two-component system response regulator LiaR